MNLIWLSKIVSGSTVWPVVDFSQAAKRALAARCGRRKPSRNAGSSVSGTSCRSNRCRCVRAQESGNGVPVVIPEQDGRVIQPMLVAQDGEGRGAKHEVAPLPRRQAQPARSQDAEEVAVAEDQDVARKRTEPPDHTVSAGTDVRDRLAARAAVAEQTPAGPLAADLIGAPPFVAAIIPFGQVGDAYGPVAEAGQLARPTRSLQRADEDPIEGQALEPLGKAPCIVLTAPGETQVCPPGVLAGDRPLRLAVPRQEDFRERFAHGPTLDTGLWAFCQALIARTPSPSVERPRLLRDSCEQRVASENGRSGGRGDL